MSQVESMHGARILTRARRSIEAVGGDGHIASTLSGLGALWRMTRVGAKRQPFALGSQPRWGWLGGPFAPRGQDDGGGLSRSGRFLLPDVSCCCNEGPSTSARREFPVKEVHRSPALRMTELGERGFLGDGRGEAEDKGRRKDNFRSRDDGGGFSRPGRHDAANISRSNLAGPSASARQGLLGIDTLCSPALRITELRKKFAGGLSLVTVARRATDRRRACAGYLRTLAELPEEIHHIGPGPEWVRAAKPGTETSPDVDVEDKLKDAFSRGWSVIVWNDPVNLMDYVVYVFKTVLKMDEKEASQRMWEVHQNGKSMVARETREKSELIVHRLRGFGLNATLEQE
jgi:ATP-dependent Clp protease adaptor protein ClpS